METATFDHGGALAQGKRKTARPLAEASPILVTLSSARARGVWSFRRPRNHRWIRRQIRELAEKFGVEVFRWHNGGRSLLILVRPKDRQSFQRYLRTLSGLIVRHVTGARKGKPVGKFWDGLAHTRVVELASSREHFPGRKSRRRKPRKQRNPGPNHARMKP